MTTREKLWAALIGVGAACWIYASWVYAVKSL